MFTVTMLLTNVEKQQIEQAAEQLWPTEKLSRTEICRRLTLAGARTRRRCYQQIRQRCCAAFR
jgi:hypothetical protein